MEITEQNVFTGKTVEEAIAEGLQQTGLTQEQADIEVLEEGKKKLFGGVKAKVKITKKLSDGERAIQFIDGLMSILSLNAVAELVSDGKKIEINVTSTDSRKVIGRHGETIDAIQNLAGAVANIGREDYRKVIVDCEGYRANREKTLTELAEKLAKKAVERERRVSLEPMNPYERRIIHSALVNSEEVKTISCGKEPNRFVVIVPNNEKPYERKNGRFGDRPFRGDREEGREGGRRPFRGGDRRERGDRRDGRNGDRPFRGDRNGAPRANGGRPRGKKEIHFGTFLGNDAPAKTEQPVSAETTATTATTTEPKTEE